MKRFAPLILVFSVLLTGLDLPPVVQPVGGAALAASEDWTEADDAAAAEFAQLENVDVACVALAIFAEARGEPYDAQALVASVIVNQQERARPGTSACDIVEAPGQFSLERWPLPRRPWRIDAPAWSKALEIARVVMAGDYTIPPPCAGATLLGARGAAPLPHTHALCEVGAHTFFAPGASPAIAQTTLP